MKKHRLRKVSSAAALLAADAILRSFGNPAQAECVTGSNSADVCVEVTQTNFCVAEQTAITVNLANYPTHPYQIDFTNGSNTDTYLTGASIGTATNQQAPFDTFNPSPASTAYNNYSGAPAGPSTNQSVDYNFTFTSPSIPANTGAIAQGNGRQLYNVPLTADSRIWNGSTWSSVFATETVQLVITVDHVNGAPAITSPSPATYTDTDLVGDLDLLVSAAISDAESNTADVIFELSTSPVFSSILQTGTYAGQNLTSGGATFSHTWTNLTEGNYYWRIRVDETTAQGVCGAAPVLLDTASSTFTIQLSSDPIATVTPTPPVTITTLPETGFTSTSLLELGLFVMFVGVCGMAAAVWHVIKNEQIRNNI